MTSFSLIRGIDGLRRGEGWGRVGEGCETTALPRRRPLYALERRVWSACGGGGGGGGVGGGKAVGGPREGAGEGRGEGWGGGGLGLKGTRALSKTTARRDRRFVSSVEA
jgi:hypothetical protein